jgi:hypothetical protein
MPDIETRYRVRLPDGQVFDMFNLAQIKRDHPNGYIEGRIVQDAVGIGVLTPYHGQQPYEAAEQRAQEAEEVQEDREAEAQEVVNYGGMTVAELRAELVTRGIEPGPDARKADLVSVLTTNDQDLALTGAGK